jgi:hypothetical protein
MRRLLPLVFALALGLGACGAKGGAPGKPAETPKLLGNASPAAHLPRSSTFVGHVDMVRFRKSSLFPAVVSFLRARGFGKLLVQQEKLCGFSAFQVIDDIAFGHGPDGWVLIAHLTTGEAEALGCVKKAFGGEMDGRSVRVDPYLVSARDGLLVAGDPRAVRAALDAQPDAAEADRLALKDTTAALFRGDLGDLTVDGRVDASPARVAGLFGLRFATAEVAAAIYDRVTKAQSRALDGAERALARDVLKSIKLSLRGSSVEISLGTDGDIAIQERYLDVLLGLLEIVLREYEGP